MSTPRLDPIEVALYELANMRDAELRDLCSRCKAGVCSAHQSSAGYIAAVGRNIVLAEEFLRLLGVHSFEEEFEVQDRTGRWLHPKRRDLAESIARKGWPMRVRLKVVFKDGSILTAPWREEPTLAAGLDLETNPVV